MSVQSAQDIASFIQSLDSMRLDCFVRVFGRIEAGGGQQKLQELEAELADVKKGINTINAKRDALRVEKEDLHTILAALTAALESGQGSPELIQMHLVLMRKDAELEEKIATTRPVELHARKARLRKEIAEKRLLARLAGMIREAVRRNGGH